MTVTVPSEQKKVMAAQEIGQPAADKNKFSILQIQQMIEQLIE